MDKIQLEEGFNIELQFEKRGGLLPAVAQESVTGEILMIGSINREAFQKTLELGLATFFSTSRNELWTKGLSSGDLLKVEDILVDCDQDAVIYKVIPQGSGACHTNKKDGDSRRSCFYRIVDNNSEKKKFKFLDDQQ
jgi:phosphoribosyl-AMP cyclohydrolase